LIIHVRCPTCGKVIGHLYEEFKKRTKKGEDPGEVLDSLGLKKECCRVVFITHIDAIDEIIAYETRITPKSLKIRKG